MADWMLIVLENLGAGLSIALMGVCGVRLLIRFIRVLRGEEEAQGTLRRCAPMKELVAVAGIMLLSAQLKRQLKAMLF